MDCIVIACMEPQEPAKVIMMSLISRPSHKSLHLHSSMSTTLKAKGVHLGPQQLKELNGLTVELDKQRTKAIEDEDWRSLLDHTQHLY